MVFIWPASGGKTSQEKIMMCILMVAFILFFSFKEAVSYRPVIVMHGVLAGPSDMDSFVDMIKTAHPGTQVC